MLDISNNISSATSIVSYTCYAGAAVLAGRKIGLAAGCKAVGLVAELLGKETATHWNQSASEYYALAKRSAFRDLTTTVGLLAAAFTMNFVGVCPLEVQEEKGFFAREFDNVYKARYELLSFQCGIMTVALPFYVAIIREELKNFIPYPGF